MDKQVIENFNKFVYEGKFNNCYKLIEEAQELNGELFHKLLWNGRFCLTSLGFRIEHEFKTNKVLVKPKNQHWLNMNPFFIYDPISKSYLVGVRIANYAGKIEGKPWIAQGQIHTFYEAFVFDEDFNLIHNFPIPQMKANFIDRNWKMAKGTEDYRVIPDPSSNHFTGFCTSMETHKEGPVRMTKFELHLDYKESIDNGILKRFITGVTFKNIVPMTGYDDGRAQKNWIPIYLEKQLHAVYSHSPTIILKVEDEGTCSPVIQNPLKLIGCKGGTNWLPFNRTYMKPLENDDNHGFVQVEEPGYLSLVHMSSDKDYRIYYHQFLWYSKDFELKAKTRIFYMLKSHTIEFAIGMLLNKDRIYITLGFEDRSAKLISIPVRCIKEELYSV